MGDININIAPDGDDAFADEYLNLTAAHGLLPAFTLTTRQVSKTCIDHVIMKSCNKNTLSLILDTFTTDHSPVLVHTEYLNKFKEQKQTERAVLDYDSITKDLAASDFSSVLTSTNANLATDALINIIREVIKRNTKIKKITRKNRTIKPWVTVGALRCLRHRDKLHLKSRNDPLNMILKVSYCRYRNFCTNLLRKLKRDYERQEFDMARNNPKATWNVIKKIANLNTKSNSATDLLKIHNDPNLSVNSVNNYFVNIGKNLAKKINSPLALSTDNSSIQCCLTSNLQGNSMVLLPTDNKEIESVIMGLRNDCATGWDHISSKIIKCASYPQENRGFKATPHHYPKL
ncbi:hypothetical protein OBRU01_02702 [Operophtera brumata]|uniref:Tick transposon n=1 Tax=Operophtera brumata TaxID=104452 RepID=A0A0L7LSV4_OPEBR|nr:hypothetical protein OBRU01_02702 [Operophtera brumata]